MSFVRTGYNRVLLQVEVQFIQSKIPEDDDVDLAVYILAYQEISKIFSVLGSVSHVLTTPSHVLLLDYRSQNLQPF